MNKSNLGIISLIVGCILLGVGFFVDLQGVVGISVMTAGVYLALIGLVLCKKIRRAALEVLFSWM